ncbi:MAG: hypothetical protein ACREIT_00640 [Tepidisphaeraceae bacterium]
MNTINPFTGSILQSSQAQRLQSSEKDRQTRRIDALKKNVAAPGEETEHQVESSQALEPVHDDDSQKDPRQPKRPPHPSRDTEAEGDDDVPHIDLTA